MITDTMSMSLVDMSISTARRAAIHQDQVLMVAIMQGDESALGKLYDRHIDRMLGLACHILGNQSDAEDVIHDVFVEVWHKAKSYDARRGSVIAWLMLRVRSRSLDRIRSLKTVLKHKRTLVQDDGIQADDSSKAYDLDDQGSAVRQALAFLPAKQRNVIELSYFRGLTCSEIAAHCGIPLGTVKTRLMAAVKRLRSYINQSEAG